MGGLNIIACVALVSVRVHAYIFTVYRGTNQFWNYRVLYAVCNNIVVCISYGYMCILCAMTIMCSSVIYDLFLQGSLDR